MHGYTHLSVLWHSTLPYMVIYVVMHHGVWLYVYFYIKGVAMHRSPYSDTRTSPNMVIHVVIPHNAWLYIKYVVIHIYLYSGISLCYIRLYTWLCVTVCGCTYIFTLKASVGIHRFPYSGTRSSPYVVTRMVIRLHVWLYIKRMVIHIYLYSDISLCHMRLYMWLYITVCGYTYNFAYVTTSYACILSFCT